MGPSCSLRTCSWNGVYNTRREECLCLEGFSGIDCEKCAAPIETDKSYICLQKGRPTQMEKKEFLLLAVRTVDATFYLEGQAPLTIGDKRIAILPDSDYEDMHYDCACRLIGDAAVTSAVSRSSSSSRDQRHDDPPTLEDLMSYLLMQLSWDIESTQYRALEMYDWLKEDLKACQFEAGLFAAYFPVIFTIVLLIVVCVILILFTLAPINRRQQE